MTHTYVVMKLSDVAYREIADQMRTAGYDHAFGSDGEIDMHGIAVALQPGLTSLTAASCGKPQSVFGGIVSAAAKESLQFEGREAKIFVACGKPWAVVGGVALCQQSAGHTGPCDEAPQ